jgi:hypothetical protein
MRDFDECVLKGTTKGDGSISKVQLKGTDLFLKGTDLFGIGDSSPKVLEDLTPNSKWSRSCIYFGSFARLASCYYCDENSDENKSCILFFSNLCLYKRK